MGEISIIYRIFVEKYQGKRPRGRHRYRWDDDDDDDNNNIIKVW
jgi:hypothetical protein